MISLPPTVFDPPFRITRASHVVLVVKDLDVSRQFYTTIAGLIVTHQTADTVYLRGIEEACHHSLVLRKGADPACVRLGLRVFMEEDLVKAKDFFEANGGTAEWAEVEFQGQTLHVTDPFGLPLELCARMPVEPRMITGYTRHRGGCGLRMDHFQVLTPNVRESCEFYMKAGFRLTEYISKPDGFNPGGVFLQRKGNPHDLVFFNGPGPQLHHFAYLAPEVHHLLYACDIASEMGYGSTVERGPGRHGPGHAQFVYFRDPDGHRVELFNTHYQAIDIETETIR
ncbi:MAG TPA: VOC family protein, partial [Stellaceae bacterium]|nr:VOC family protein [Stellaceae bacterium]